MAEMLPVSRAHGPATLDHLPVGAVRRRCFGARLRLPSASAFCFCLLLLPSASASCLLRLLAAASN